MNNRNKNSGPCQKAATDQASPVTPSTTEQDRVTPRSGSADELRGLTPADVKIRSNRCTDFPQDSIDARKRYGAPYIMELESQADFVVGCMANGSYIRNFPGVAAINEKHYKYYYLGSGDELFSPCETYMSRLLATIDGPENVIWGKDGFATGYRLPGNGWSFLGEMYPWVLDRFCFRTIPAAWEEYGWEGEGISLAHYYRILSHRWMGFLTPTESDDGWRPGPSNRRRRADGVIEGSVDYVIIHPSSGELYLTPHGEIVTHDLVRKLAMLIF